MRYFLSSSACHQGISLSIRPTESERKNRRHLSLSFSYLVFQVDSTEESSSTPHTTMFSDDNTNARLSNSTPEFFLKPTNTLTYYFVPFYARLFLIGTFGNGLVIISILRSSRLRTVTNTYLLNIAVADFMLLLSVPFLIVTILANGWIFGDILCKMYYNFIHINQYVSSLLLAALSFDRYLAVCHPIRAIKFRTSTKCALIIAGEKRRTRRRRRLMLSLQVVG